MKVCFIVGTLGRGGAERQLVYMLKALQMSGHDARVLSLTQGEANQNKIEELGIEVEWLGRRPNKAVRLSKIIANLRRRTPDIIQSSHFYTNLYAAFAGRALRVPDIGAIRNDLVSEIEANGVYGWWQVRSPRHLIVNSERARSRAIDAGIDESKIDLIKNVVEIENVPAKPAASDKRRLNILFAGRLVRQKRPDLFVEMARTVLEQFTDRTLNFEIAGDGPLRTLLERQVREIGIRDGVISFLGEESDMDSAYRRADILVLTSDHEGTPNVALEAMAHGLPIVATRAGGIEEILNEERGMLVELGDIRGLSAAVAALINQPELRITLGSNGRKYVADNHSLAYLQNRLVGVYGTLLSDRNGNV